MIEINNVIGCMVVDSNHNIPKVICRKRVTRKRKRRVVAFQVQMMLSLQTNVIFVLRSRERNHEKNTLPTPHIFPPSKRKNSGKLAEGSVGLVVNDFSPMLCTTKFSSTQAQRRDLGGKQFCVTQT